MALAGRVWLKMVLRHGPTLHLTCWGEWSKGLRPQLGDGACLPDALRAGESPVLPCLHSAWYWGYCAVYDSGGYVQELGLSLEESRARLAFLQLHNWLDSRWVPRGREQESGSFGRPLGLTPGQLSPCLALNPLGPPSQAGVTDQMQ